MSGVFVYLDNSNIFHAAQDLAEERNGDQNARYRVRMNFENLLRLAHADRPLAQAVAAGYIPPALINLWNHLGDLGIATHLSDRGEPESSDQWLQLRMLEDAADRTADPGTVVLLTGHSVGYDENRGFHATLERMHRLGWKIEVLSWLHSCNLQMREWVEANGVFIPLDDYYESITFTNAPRIGNEMAELDLSGRAVA